MPFGEFSEGLKLRTVGVSLVNHDNNQHGPDENLRLRNLWEGIDLRRPSSPCRAHRESDRQP